MDHGLETLLIKLNNIIELKRRQLESLTREYNVLLKPWPKDKNLEEENPKKKENDIKEKGHCGEISAEEQTGVHLVEKVLVQAQRARNLKEKLEKKQKSNTEECKEDLLKNDRLDADEHCDSETSIRSMLRNSILEEKKKNAANVSSKINKDESESNVSQETKSENKQLKKKIEIETCSNKKDASHGRVPLQTKSSSIENNPVQSRKPQSRSSSNNRKPSNIAKSALGTRSASQGRKGATEVERWKETFREPRVARASSGRGRPYSAHVNAPFKTDPTLRVPRTSSNKSAMAARKPPTSGLRNINSKPGGSHRALKTDTIKAGSCSCPKPGDIQDSERTVSQEALNRDLKQFGFEEKSDSIPDLHQEAIMSESSPPDQSRPAVKEAEPPETLVVGLKELHVTQHESQLRPDATPKEKLFSLLTDGNKILIPSKLRRLVSTNQKLREKVAALKVTKRVESQDAKLSFMSRLNGEFWPDRDLVEQTRVLSCLSAYTCLLHLLEELQLDSVTELTRVEDVLSAKLKMEYILASCDSLQDQMNSLSVADIDVRSNMTGPDVPCVQEAGVHQWLPAELYGDMPATQRPDSLVYRTRAELQTYRQHSFQLQYLQLQTAIAGRVQTELLPLLQSMDTKSCCYIPVYRAMFSLLTSEGQHLPGIVKDS